MTYLGIKRFVKSKICVDNKDKSNFIKKLYYNKLHIYNPLITRRKSLLFSIKKLNRRVASFIIPFKYIYFIIFIFLTESYLLLTNLIFYSHTYNCNFYLCVSFVNILYIYNYKYIHPEFVLEVRALFKCFNILHSSSTLDLSCVRPQPSCV